MSPPSTTRRRLLQALGAAGATSTLPTVATADGTATREFGPRGRAVVRRTADAVVGEDDTTVYVAASDGFAVVDVSDPDDPTVLAERRDLLADRESGPLRGIKDVAVDGDRLLVVGPDSREREALQGAAVYDVSDPSAPELVRFVPTSHGVHNADLVGTTAYLTGTGLSTQPLVAVDIESGAELGRWSVVDRNRWWAHVNSTVHNCHDVQVVDGVAYVSQWDAGTWLVDVSDPESMSAMEQLGGRDPERLAQLDEGEQLAAVYEMPGNHHVAALHPDGDLLAVGHEAFEDPRTDRNGAPAGIGFWDLGSSGPPERVGSVAPPNVDIDESTPGPGWRTAHNFAWRGDRLYASWYSGGVQVLDVSDPAEPGVLASWRDPGNASFWAASPVDGGFVGASRPVRGEESVAAEGKVLTFPEPDGESQPAPSGVWPGRPAEFPTPSSTPTPSPTPTSSPSPSPTETATGTPTSGSGPGFGPLAALTGVAGGALALWRRTQER